jgi:hypothetical protein
MSRSAKRPTRTKIGGNLWWTTYATGGTVDGKVGRQARKYMLMDDGLYRRTMDGLLLKYLNKDQA